MKAFLGVVLVLFVVLAVLASRFPYFELDVRLARGIQSIALPGFKTLMVGISWAGSGWVPWVLTCATGSVLVLFRLRLEGVLCMAGVGTGAAINELLKVLIARPRPAEGAIEVSIKYPGQSFPSGHVVFFVVYCGFLVFLAFALLKPGPVRKVSLAFLSLPILLGGISRVYLGAHWPSDVTGGYLAGGILLALVITVYCRRRGALSI
jgi:membrane-associated phospholipid phosphatase